MKPQGSSINKPGSKYSQAPVIYNRSLFKTGATHKSDSNGNKDGRTKAARGMITATKRARERVRERVREQNYQCIVP
jgi:hypothetical protein